jgi:hypothetical protein
MMLGDVALGSATVNRKPAVGRWSRGESLSVPFTVSYQAGNPGG